MPTQPQRLLELSTEFLAQEPWAHVDERSVFLVLVPGHSIPFAVTVFGDTVDVMGIEVSLEPNGFRRLASLHDPDTSDDEVEAFKPGRALSLVFLPPGQIPPDFRKVWKAAAFKPRGSRPAPQFAATDGGDEIRPIKRSEGTILGYCTHAVLDAMAEGRLTPPDISDGLEAALLLTIPGADAFEDPELARVEVDVVDWPDSDGVIPPQHEISDETRAAVKALEPSEGILAVTAFVSMGCDEPPIAEDTYVVALLDPKEETVVGTAAAEEAEDGSIELALTSLLKAAGQRPATLILEDPRVALVAFPMCRELGIEPRMGYFFGPLADLVDDTIVQYGGTASPRSNETIDALEALGGESIPMDFPTALTAPSDWLAAYRYTSAVLLIDAQHSGALSSATHQYWGGARERTRVAELMGSLGAGQAFLNYAFEDYRSTADGPSVLEEFLTEARGSDELGAEELALYELRRDAVVSIFELSDDASTATDLLTQEAFPVDLDLDGVSRFSGHAMLMRRYELGGHQAFCTAGFPVPKEEADDLLSRVQASLGAPPTHERLRTHGNSLGSIWLQMVARLDEALKTIRAHPV
ncbi:MAG: hypothetical protein ACJA2W_003432 [Planctomycetota bacterium]|jgi:hypothetical protein